MSSFDAGTKLGDFEIVDLIDEGGMGSVYRARDTRLGRTVAIKVLPEDFSKDDDRLARFEREARAVSSLNHPHICALFDVGVDGDTHFMVLEFIEGETLAKRLERGALSPSTSIRIAIEIADALDRAHREGIVHRDLKPGNLMLTKSGIKLLDFGLAKPIETSAMGGLDPETKTRSAPLTNAGLVLGTVPYMAPEQLEGRTVDARADLFALGAVLYEMLTARRAFEGSSAASLIGAILRSEPVRPSELSPVVPEALDRVVADCLAKDPEERWQTARDLKRALEWIQLEPAHAPEPKAPASYYSVPAAAFVAGLLIAASVAWLSRAPESPEPIRRFEIIVEPSDRLVTGTGRPFAISPDGRNIVYSAARDGVVQLFRRSLDSLRALRIPGSEGGRAPFFSPDSLWVGFEVGLSLRKVPLTGGEPTTLCDAPGTIRGATWSADSVVFAVNNSSLWSVPDIGGTPRPITELDATAGEIGHLSPQVLGTENGNAVLYTVWLGLLDTAQIAVANPRNDEQRTLVQGTNPVFVPAGYIVFERGYSLWAVPFDPESLSVDGEAFPLSFSPRILGGTSQFAVAMDGTLVYSPGTESTGALLWVDRNGDAQSLLEESSTPLWPRLSPEEERITFTLADGGGHREVYLYDLRRGSRQRLTSSATFSAMGEWSPDSSQFLMNVGGDETNTIDIHVRPVLGDARTEPLLARPFSQLAPTWSPDGASITYTEISPETARDIWVLRIGEEPIPFATTPFNERAPRFSPSGDWIAYVSDASGQDEVYVQGYPRGETYLVSAGGGTEPQWSRNGTELYYRNTDVMMSVRLTTTEDNGLIAEPPVQLFEGSYEVDRTISAAYPNYDVARDGRFLMVQSGPPNAHRLLRVVLNWDDELRALDPNEPQ